MTRQKKEILRKVDEIERFIGADMELGCGFAPAGFYNPLYQQIDSLMEQLAELRHYGSAMEMIMDNRKCAAQSLPWA